MYGYSIQSVTSLYRCSNLQHVLPSVRISLQTDLSGIGIWIIVVAPALWVIMEYARANLFFLALPWNFIGHSQYQSLFLIQISEITGMYGISFLIVMVNQFLSQLPELFVGQKNDPSNVTAIRIFNNKWVVPLFFDYHNFWIHNILWGTENQIVGERCLSSCGHDSGQCCHKKQDDIA
jgi:apolipoprotein N-acyltransferase